MDEQTEKIVAEQMKSLPKDVLDAIFAVDYKTKLQEITRRQKLLIDQAGKLEMETTLIMIGLEPLGDFTTNLQRELNVPILKAKEVAMDVSENIFKPIRESLRSMNEKIGDEEEILVTTEPVHPSRDQILNEIEDPSLIGRQIETLSEVPYQQDIKVPEPEKKEVAEGIVPPRLNVMETKMAGMTITPQQVVEIKTENKLPPVEKNKPSGGVDPYREAIQ